MACLKCGRETEGQQVFCSDCHQTMNRYPVNPDTVVVLPKRPAIPEEQKAARKQKRPEEQEALLKRMIRWLLITIGVLTTLVCLLAGLLLYNLTNTPTKPNIGQNYTFIDPSAGK
mgnify:CR=1 FL=1